MAGVHGLYVYVDVCVFVCLFEYAFECWPGLLSFLLFFLLMRTNVPVFEWMSCVCVYVWVNSSVRVGICRRSVKFARVSVYTYACWPCFLGVDRFSCRI